jgi:dihydrofolate reductase
MTVHLIATISPQGVIHSTDIQPWQYKSKWFQMQTERGVLIMGRKMWESFPPLETHRHCFLIVVSQSRHECTETDGVVWCSSLQEAVKISNPLHTYIIGGAQIFKQALLLKVVDVYLVTQFNVENMQRKPLQLFLPPDRRVFWKSQTLHDNQGEFCYEMSLVRR